MNVKQLILLLQNELRDNPRITSIDVAGFDVTVHVGSSLDVYVVARELSMLNDPWTYHDTGGGSHTECREIGLVVSGPWVSSK